MTPILGTSRTVGTGLSAGITPSVSLVTGPISVKLLVSLGADRLEIGLGADAHAAIAAIVAIRDGLDAVLTEVKET